MSQFKQILYASEATRLITTEDLYQILNVSRHNNALNGVTGLLWSDGKRFVQALEGVHEAVDHTVAKLLEDSRHTNLRFFKRKDSDEREFGEWSMAFPDIDLDSHVYDSRMMMALREAEPEVQSKYLSLLRK